MAFIAYLLGVLLTKWEINHQQQRIRMCFPLTRKAVVKDLCRYLGGFHSTVVTDNKAYLVYELGSKAGLQRLRQMIQRGYTTIPSGIAANMLDWSTATLQKLSRRRKARRLAQRQARSV